MAKINKNNETTLRQAKAVARFSRISTKKMLPILNMVRGRDVSEAMACLKFAPQKGAKILLKLLKSAAANAENNHQMESEALYVAETFADQGPTLVRFRPMSMGRVGRIRKRTSHTTVVLRERPEVLEKLEIERTTARKKAKPVVEKAETTADKKEA